MDLNARNLSIHHANNNGISASSLLDQLHARLNARPNANILNSNSMEQSGLTGLNYSTSALSSRSNNRDSARNAQTIRSLAVVNDPLSNHHIIVGRNISNELQLEPTIPPRRSSTAVRRSFESVSMRFNETLANLIRGATCVPPVDSYQQFPIRSVQRQTTARDLSVISEDISVRFERVENKFLDMREKFEADDVPFAATLTELFQQQQQILANQRKLNSWYSRVSSEMRRASSEILSQLESQIELLQKSVESIHNSSSSKARPARQTNISNLDSGHNLSNGHDQGVNSDFDFETLEAQIHGQAQEKLRLSLEAINGSFSDGCRSVNNISQDSTDSRFKKLYTSASSANQQTALKNHVARHALAKTCNSPTASSSTPTQPLSVSLMQDSDLYKYNLNSTPSSSATSTPLKRAVGQAPASSRVLAQMTSEMQQRRPPVRSNSSTTNNSLTTSTPTNTSASTSLSTNSNVVQKSNDNEDDNNNNNSSNTNEEPDKSWLTSEQTIQLQGQLCNLNQKPSSKVAPDSNSINQAANKLQSTRGAQDFNCKEPGCGKIFSSLRKLRHHHVVHSDNFPFLCNIDGCTKRFKRKFGVDLHSTTHFELIPTMYSKTSNSSSLPFFGRRMQYSMCKPCGKKFKTVQDYQYHMMRHGEEPFKCPVKGCGQKFSIWKSFQKHRASHYFNYHCRMDSQCKHQTSNLQLLKLHIYCCHFRRSLPPDVPRAMVHSSASASVCNSASVSPEVDSISEFDAQPASKRVKCQRPNSEEDDDVEDNEDESDIFEDANALDLIVSQDQGQNESEEDSEKEIQIYVNGKGQSHKDKINGQGNKNNIEESVEFDPKDLMCRKSRDLDHCESSRTRRISSRSLVTSNGNHCDKSNGKQDNNVNLSKNLRHVYDPNHAKTLQPTASLKGSSKDIEFEGNQINNNEANSDLLNLEVDIAEEEANCKQDSKTAPPAPSNVSKLKSSAPLRDGRFLRRRSMKSCYNSSDWGSAGDLPTPTRLGRPPKSASAKKIFRINTKATS